METWCEGYFYINLMQARASREEGLSTEEKISIGFTWSEIYAASLWLLIDWVKLAGEMLFLGMYF